jgi:ribosomal protein L30E
MANETKTEIVSQIKKLIENDKIIIGSTVILKELKKGNVKKILLSTNVPKSAKEDIEHYSKLSATEIIQTNISNEEFGIICKRSFLISAIGEKK